MLIKTHIHVFCIGLLLSSSACRSIVKYDPSVQFRVGGVAVDEVGEPVVAVLTVECVSSNEVRMDSIETSPDGRFDLDLAQGTWFLSFAAGATVARRWVDLHPDSTAPSLGVDLGAIPLLPTRRIVLTWEEPGRRRVVVITDEDELDQAEFYGQARALDGKRATFDVRGRRATVGVLDLATMAVTRRNLELATSSPREYPMNGGTPVDWIDLRCTKRPTQQWPWSVDRHGDEWRFERSECVFDAWKAGSTSVQLTSHQQVRVQETLHRILAGYLCLPPALPVYAEGEVDVGSLLSRNDLPLVGVFESVTPDVRLRVLEDARVLEHDWRVVLTEEDRLEMKRLLDSLR